MRSGRAFGRRLRLRGEGVGCGVWGGGRRDSGTTPCRGFLSYSQVTSKRYRRPDPLATPTLGTPFRIGNAPFDISRAPFDISAAPFDISGAPFDISGAPFDISRAPFDISRAPFDISRAPFDISGTPFHISRPPFQFGGAPFDIEEAPFDHDSLSISKLKARISSEGSGIRR